MRPFTAAYKLLSVRKTSSRGYTWHLVAWITSVPSYLWMWIDVKAAVGNVTQPIVKRFFWLVVFFARFATTCSSISLLTMILRLTRNFTRTNMNLYGSISIVFYITMNLARRYYEIIRKIQNNPICIIFVLFI